MKRVLLQISLINYIMEGYYLYEEAVRRIHDEELKVCEKKMTGQESVIPILIISY